MKLLGSTILLLLGLLPGALAQDSAPGQTRAPIQEPAQEQAGTHNSAQTPLADRDVKGRAGRDIRLLVFTNVRPDCSSGPLPTIRLVSPPANGKITVKRGRLNATNVRQCLSISVPALVAFYRSTVDFEGSDTVILEVRPVEGTPQLRRFTISVSGAGGQSI